ncbi:pyridoxal phosphate-dependent decarboxylase family protein [Streptomyces sp. 7N604]|uniref:pyridoxal phosphate-dependent decarboxylase family protein n=1 Tax=Streptomyces sp. 7N604 TaxID=3457415 RepID=UPI003FD4605E
MGQLSAIGHAVLAELDRYREATRRGDAPVVSAMTIDEVAEKLGLQQWMDRGDMGVTELVSFVSHYCELATNLNHPRYMAHQLAPTDTPAVIADLINSVTNNTTLIYEMGPGGSAVDRAVCDWMLAKIGWSGTGGSTLTSGGTLGNLIALLAARSYGCPGSWRDGNPPDLTVLAAPSSHYSVRRSVAVMGLGESALWPLETDRWGRIDLDRLPAAIAAARDRGRRPIALVGTACVTASGLHDALEPLADLCRDEGIWFHVDGAHGAAALLSPRRRGRLAGIERANSVSWDAHKMLRTSTLCTGVLFRERDFLDGLFQQQARYLFRDESVDLDWGQRSFETTKPVLGLKLFLTLACRGEQALGEYVDQQYAKAELLWELIDQRPDFSCPYRPESNVMCFRYLPAGADQERVRQRLRSAGRFHLSSTRLDGEEYLRVSLMSPYTGPAELRELLDAIAGCGVDAK